MEGKTKTKVEEDYFFVQYYGNEANLSNILKAVRADYDSHENSLPVQLNVYIKVEDGMAYYVADNDYQGKVGMWNSRVLSSDEPEMDLTGSDNVEFQYKGKSVEAGTILGRIKEKMHVTNPDLKIFKLEIYVKIEDETAYYLANDGISGKVSMFS